MQTSNDDATHDIDEVSNNTSDGSATGEKFEVFPLMPSELQIAVARLAFNKPGIHYAGIERQPKAGGKYELRLFGLSEQKASSFFEYKQTYDNLVKAKIGLKATDVFLKPLYLGNSAYLIDADPDMVCVTDIRLSLCNFSEPPLLGRNLQMEMNRSAVGRVLSGIQRVGVADRIKENGPPMVQLPCPIRQGLHNHGHHQAFTHCSVELAAFFGCFPDLKVAYVLMRPGWDKTLHAWSLHAHIYCRSYFSRTPAERNALGLDMFYDAQQKFVQFTPDFNDKLKPPFNKCGKYFRQTLQMLEETRNIFTERYDKLPDKAGADFVKHAMSLERREAVQFKLMICSGFQSST